MDVSLTRRGLWALASAGGMLACVLLASGPTRPFARLAGPESAVAHEFDAPCRLSDWVGLGKCKRGSGEPGCAEAYEQWFGAGCLCDYSAYPWGFLPRNITPVGFAWALMTTGAPRAYAEIAAGAACMEQPGDCLPPREGDVRLDGYGHGSLSMFYAQQWRRVLGALSNATALAQCQRLGARARAALARRARRVRLFRRRAPCARAGFAEGGVRPENAAARRGARAGLEPEAVIVEEPCEPAEPLLECARRSARASSQARRPLVAARLSCRSVGPAGCFYDRGGQPRCLQGARRYERSTAPPRMPSMACGSAGTAFLERPPLVPPEAGRDERASCAAFFDNALGRCGGRGAQQQGAPERRLCSRACHDAALQAIRRDDCFSTPLESGWGRSYGEGLRAHAERAYASCGPDVWQGAALPAGAYERCVGLLLQLFRTCDEGSERRLCSGACVQALDEAAGAQSCAAVRYHRGQPRPFRGHVALLGELRDRVCRSPPDWGGGALGAAAAYRRLR